MARYRKIDTRMWGDSRSPESTTVPAATTPAENLSLFVEVVRP